MACYGQVNASEFLLLNCDPTFKQMLTTLFRCGLIRPMQSSNASKKAKMAEENSAPAPESSTAAEGISKPRTSSTSKLKKETGERGRATHRKAASPETVIESSPVVESPVIDSVGVLTPATRSAEVGTRSSEISPSHEEIAKLAHSYWVARGYANGSPEQDWLHAEQELRSRR